MSKLLTWWPAYYVIIGICLFYMRYDESDPKRQYAFYFVLIFTLTLSSWVYYGG